MSKHISLRELAQSLNVSPATITYYTNLGLFHVAEVNGKKKMYDKDEAAARYAKIQKARQQGYNLGLIKKIFEEGKDKEWG